MGGTRLLPALKAAVGTCDCSRTTDIVVLTDGEVWDLDDTLNFVRTSRMNSNNRIRYFSLGIGTAVSHALIEGIAKLGGGYAEVIPLANHGGWKSRLVAVLEATLTGKIGPIRVELEHGVENGVVPQEQHPGLINNYVDERFKMMQSPATALTLSPFIRNRLFVIYEALPPTAPLPGLRLYTTQPDGREVTVWVPIKARSVPDTMIHELAARAMLGDLERGESSIHFKADKLFDEGEAVRSEGERLGLTMAKMGQRNPKTGIMARMANDMTKGMAEQAEEPAMIRPEPTNQVWDHLAILTGPARGMAMEALL
ncbi:hypothetical protein VTH82DRAFT_3271 [Thermothelomyces myriococcoides]